MNPRAINLIPRFFSPRENIKALQVEGVTGGKLEDFKVDQGRDGAIEVATHELYWAVFGWDCKRAEVSPSTRPFPDNKAPTLNGNRPRILRGEGGPGRSRFVSVTSRSSKVGSRVERSEGTTFGVLYGYSLYLIDGYRLGCSFGGGSK